MLSQLKRCAASIADQEGVSFEHLVIDGASTDGTREWLRQNPQIRSISEKDDGMYHAINKGLRLATGDIVAYLNCDEQYVPGTLLYVKRYLQAHPKVEFVYGNCLVIDPEGNLMAFKKSYPLRSQYVLASSLYASTCTLFFRRKLFETGLEFDTNLRAVSDADFVVKLLKHGFRYHHLKRYFAAFTLTGQNLSWTEIGLRELLDMHKRNAGWLRYFRYPLLVMELFEKVLSGAFWERLPITYSVYIKDLSDGRKTFSSSTVSFSYKSGSKSRMLFVQAANAIMSLRKSSTESP